MLNNTSDLHSFEANGGLQVETPYDIYTNYAFIYPFPLFLEWAHMGSYVHFALVWLS